MNKLLLVLVLFLTSCYGTYYITDAEYSDAREEHASITYHNNQIYWGWHSGYYYYYGKPHYYPWYYYYNTCPPSYYNTTTHVIIKRPVNKPTHRPTWNKPNRPVKTNTNVIVKPKITTLTSNSIKKSRKVNITIFRLLRSLLKAIADFTQSY